MRRLFFWSPVFVAAFLCVACNRSSSSNGLMGTNMIVENQERARIGLRPVSTNWSLYSTEFDEENWKITPDGWLAKKVHRVSGGKIAWEEDYYYSGRKFVTPKGQAWEFLTVHYDYSSGTINVSYIGLDPTNTSLLDKLGLGSTDAQKIQDVEQILKEWGIPRL